MDVLTAAMVVVEERLEELRGAPGAPGKAGTRGRDGRDGEPNFTWRGAWTSVGTYEPGDVVESDGSAYICTATTALKPPGEAWDLFVSKGTGPGPVYIPRGGGSSSGGAPTGPAGGDLAGTYPDPTVQDDSHSHTGATLPASADLSGINFLVGTASGDLSAEIAVGATPGGELGGTWASPTVDATHSGSTHAAAQAAAESTAAGALTTHAAAADPHTGYRLESADHTHATTGAQGGTVAHTALTSVGANDHHAQTHATAHQPSGADAMAVDAAQATGSLRTITTSAAAAIGTAAAGNGTAAASSNHVHATGAGTPSTQAFADAAATGSGPAAAMTDHKHAMMANPVPVTWTRASSFPGSPATGQIVIRSDINDMEFFYDGTRWRSKQVFTTQSDNVVLMPQAVSGTAVVSGLWEPTYAVWLIELRGMPYVVTTNNGTNFWTIAASDFAAGTVLASFTTAADTASTVTGHVAAIGASTTGAVGIVTTKTLAPGTLYHNSFITYQIIAT